jgi:RimK family alpha-L-glutamate ligase
MLKGLLLTSSQDKDKESTLYSVVRLKEAAEAKNVSLTVVNPSQFELIVSRDDRKSLLVDNEHISLPDFVLPRMGAETSYYALSVIRHMEQLGIMVCNDSAAIGIVKDKLHMAQVLANSKLPTPKTLLAKFPINPSVVTNEIGYPCILKNVTGTQGSGIHLCESEQDMIDVMDLVFSNNEKANIIIQEFIHTSRGRDLRVFVIGGKVAGCMQRSSKTSFKANYSRGGAVEPYPLSPEISWLAIETARLLNLDIAGVDLLFTDDGFKICEANSSPGFSGLEEVTGKVIAEQIIDYIKVRLGVGI